MLLDHLLEVLHELVLHLDLLFSLGMVVKVDIPTLTVGLVWLPLPFDLPFDLFFSWDPWFSAALPLGLA